MLPDFILHFILKREVLLGHPEFQSYNKKRLSSVCLGNIAMDLQKMSWDF